MRAAIIAIVLASCAGTTETVPTKFVQTASVGYDIPDDWQRTDSSMRRLSTTVWTPKENPDRMSVTVIRTERSPLTAKLDGAALDQLLVQAQSALYAATPSNVAEISTPQGLKGSRISVEYTPPGLKARYHRTHVVLADGDGLIHLMLTAESATSTPAFDSVLASIRHVEAQP